GDSADPDDAPRKARIVVIVLSILSVALALFVPDDIFSRVLFAWHAIGAAFGPLLVARLLGWQPAARTTLIAMLSGFLLTVFLHELPNAPGDWMERLLPLALSTGVILASTKERLMP
ncbi:MAG: hypothetical protein AAF270_16455, partial [Pseudomonadota bacterium]